MFLFFYKKVVAFCKNFVYTDGSKINYQFNYEREV